MYMYVVKWVKCKPISIYILMYVLCGRYVVCGMCYVVVGNR